LSGNKSAICTFVICRERLLDLQELTALVGKHIGEGKLPARV